MELVEGPKLPTFVDLKRHLSAEPLYLQVLEDYLRNAARIINELQEKLERSEQQAHRGASPQPSETMIPQHERDQERDLENDAEVVLRLRKRKHPEGEEEEPAPVLFSAPVLFESVAEEEMAERREESHELILNEDSVDEAPRAPEVGERMEVETVRELVLRSRTVQVPIAAAEGYEATPAGPEPFHVPAMEGLPVRYREMLVTPSSDPYTVVRTIDGSTTIACGLCRKQFGTLKGWRIHAARMHKQNGFCQKCGHFVDMPHDSRSEEIAARMELHSMEWCPKASKAVMDERAVKRRRLELVGRNEEAEQFYIPDRCRTRPPTTDD